MLNFIRKYIVNIVRRELAMYDLDKSMNERIAADSLAMKYETIELKETHESIRGCASFTISEDQIPAEDRNSLSKIFALCECGFAFPVNSAWGKRTLDENLCPVNDCDEYLYDPRGNKKHYKKVYGRYKFVKDGVGRCALTFLEIKKEILMSKRMED